MDWQEDAVQKWLEGDGQGPYRGTLEIFTGGGWDGALKNYGPNLGYDYGGRLMSAWLDR